MLFNYVNDVFYSFRWFAWPRSGKKWFVWPRSGEKDDIELKNITSSFSTILGQTNHWKESI